MIGKYDNKTTKINGVNSLISGDDSVIDDRGEEGENDNSVDNPPPAFLIELKEQIFLNRNSDNPLTVKDLEDKINIFIGKNTGYIVSRDVFSPKGKKLDYGHNTSLNNSIDSFYKNSKGRAPYLDTEEVHVKIYTIYNEETGEMLSVALDINANAPGVSSFYGENYEASATERIYARRQDGNDQHVNHPISEMYDGIKKKTPSWKTFFSKKSEIDKLKTFVSKNDKDHFDNPEKRKEALSKHMVNNNLTTFEARIELMKSFFDDFVAERKRLLKMEKANTGSAELKRQNTFIQSLVELRRHKEKSALELFKDEYPASSRLKVLTAPEGEALAQSLIEVAQNPKKNPSKIFQSALSNLKSGTDSWEEAPNPFKKNYFTTRWERARNFLRKKEGGLNHGEDEELNHEDDAKESLVEREPILSGMETIQEVKNGGKEASLGGNQQNPAQKKIQQNPDQKSRLTRVKGWFGGLFGSLFKSKKAPIVPHATGTATDKEERDSLLNDDRTVSQEAIKIRNVSIDDRLINKGAEELNHENDGKEALLDGNQQNPAQKKIQQNPDQKSRLTRVKGWFGGLFGSLFKSKKAPIVPHATGTATDKEERDSLNTTSLRNPTSLMNPNFNAAISSSHPSQMNLDEIEGGEELLPCALATNSENSTHIQSMHDGIYSIVVKRRRPDPNDKANERLSESWDSRNNSRKSSGHDGDINGL